MLYLIAEWFHFEGLSNLFRYQSFRSGAALMTALGLGLLIGRVSSTCCASVRARGSRSARTARRATLPSAARRPWAG